MEPILPSTALFNGTQAQKAAEYNKLASLLYTVGGITEPAERSLFLLNLKLRSVETLKEDKAKIEDITKKLDVYLSSLDQTGATKTIAKVAKFINDKAKIWLASVDESLKNLDSTTKKIAKVTEKIEDTLGVISSKTEELGILVDAYSRKIAVAGQNLEKADQLTSTGIPYFGGDETPTDFVREYKVQLALAGLKNQDTILEVADVISDLTGVTNAFGGFTAFLDVPVLGDIDEFSDVLRSISDAFEPVFSPLAAIHDAIGPVLDALGSVFGWLLAPAEAALDAIIDATGINELLDKMAEEILSSLPESDILDGITEELERIFLGELVGFFEDNIENPFNDLIDQVEGPDFPFNHALGTNGDDILYGSLTSVGSLTLNGLLGNDILIGGDFDDLLIGSGGRDMFIGGGGDDELLGGTNPDDDPDIAVYTGSINDYTIVSVLENGFNNGTWYVTDYQDEDEITFNSNTDRIYSGTDKLVGIEVIFFADEVLDLREIDTFIRTRSDDGQFVQVSPDYTDLPDLTDGNGNPILDGSGNPIRQVTADGGNDRIFGALGLDELVTARGDDQLNSGDNGAITKAPTGDGGLNAEGDRLFGGPGNDVYVASATSGGRDLIFDESGIDAVDYKLSAYAISAVLGQTGTEARFAPVNFGFAASPNGRLGPDGVTTIGILQGIENIEGSEFSDVFFGSNAINKINGRDGDDQIRGMGGNDIISGGAGDDILIGDAGDDYLAGGTGSNTYIGGLGNDYIFDVNGALLNDLNSFSTVKYSAVAISNTYDQSVQFYDYLVTPFGDTDPYDMPGGIVILPTEVPGQQQVSKYTTSVLVGDRFGIDYLEGIERIVASTGSDLITTSRDIDQVVYGNGGDDILKSGKGATVNAFYGGAGNDLFESAFQARDHFEGGEDSDTVRIWGGNSIEGDLLFGDDGATVTLEGTDVLDFSQSDFSWHLYLNPIADNGTAVGKSPMSTLFDEGTRFVQQTLGVDGVVARPNGQTDLNARYPDVNLALVTADPNTINPGGRANGVAEFEVIIGSMQRDFISGGNPNSEMRFEGRGGDDVLFAAQRQAAFVDGGDGNDILGTFNDSYPTETIVSFYDVTKITDLIGGSGNDVFVAGDFRERIDGGADSDLLTYEASQSGVSVDLFTLTLDHGYATGDILIGGIEDVVGSQFADTLTGDDGINELVGWDGADILRGLGSSDTLFGNDGADQLFGGDGNDMLHGGNGADLLDGGEGTDTASWNLFQVHPKGGFDRLTNDLTGVIADLETGTAGIDTLVDIENLSGGGGNDEFFGDGFDNLLAGNLGDDLLDGRAGNDVLIGGHGDDTLRGGLDDDFLSGGAGSNTLEGGEGFDTIDYGILSYGVSITMAGVGNRTGLSTGETISLTPYDFYVWSDSLTMGPGPTGLPGDEIETGTSEIRYTQQQNDQGTDDPSDDIFIQADPITPERIWQLDPLTADEASDLEPVAFLPDVLLAEQKVSVVQRYDVATDTFSSIERIAGSRGNDIFLGNAEDTFFYGGEGADDIDGGAGVDTAGYQFSEAGVTVDLQNDVYFGGDAEGDTLKNIQHLVGSAYNDVLGGDAGDNRLTLGLGDDRVTGGFGTDTAVFEFSSEGLHFQFDTEGLRVIRADGETVLSTDFVGNDVELLEFADRTLTYAEAIEHVITGTEGNDLLIGSPIADPIEGRGGEDTIEGRASADTLDGGADNDLLIGEGGNDRLIGGTGIDRFVGGPGDDTFVLDSASEVVEEAPNEGTDTVEIDTSYALPDNVERLILSGSNLLTGTGNGLDNALYGSADGNTVLIGLGGEDSLFNLGGQDTLIGGTGSDTYSVTDGSTVVIETVTGGQADRVLAFTDFIVPDHVEIIEARSAFGVSLSGKDDDEVFVDHSGNNSFDGKGGIDELVILTELSDVQLDYDFSTGEVLMTTDMGTDRLINIEFVRETVDGVLGDAFSISDVLDLIFGPQHVQLDASHPFDNKEPIDMTPEGGGTQFLHVASLNSGNSEASNTYIFETAFKDGGKGIFGGTNFLNDDAQATRLYVDFSGGNTPQMFLEGFDKPLQTMINADWDYYQLAIFGGDDLIKGSYYDDKLVGYRGNDVIFGGLGDKENYNVFTDFDINPVPDRITTPGEIANDPAFLVFDGDDLIDGREGHDTLDGGTGADTLLGGWGDDVLFGGGGLFDDRLDGGTGNDTHVGGEGSDTFVMTMGMGQDLVLDFEVGVDLLDFKALSAAERSLITVDIVDFDTVVGLSDGSSMTLSGVELSVLPAATIDISLPGLNGVSFDVGAPFDSVTVSGVGDINNDGYDDFAIGEITLALPADFAPTVTVFLGDPTAPGTSSFKIEGLEGTTALAVSNAGDVNNDGIDDLIVGSNDESHVIFGKDTPFDSTLRFETLGSSDGFQINVPGSFNASFVAGGFDFNGDGIDDIAVGSSAEAPSGATYVIFGSSDAFGPEFDVTTLNGANGIKLTLDGNFEDAGDSVASAGDLNGDNIDDLVIGAPYLSVTDPEGTVGPEFLGGAFVVFGSDGPLSGNLELSTMSAAQGFRISAPFDNDPATNLDLVGRNVSGGHDVNGDGFDDLLIGVGTPTSNAPDQPARAYLIYGRDDGFGTELRLEDLDGTNGSAFTLDFPDPGSLNLGIGSVALVEDMNNDGLADIVIGTNTTQPVVNGTLSDDTTGKVHVIYGTADGYGAAFEINKMSEKQGLVFVDDTADGFGRSVASAGDVNGDGGNDIILGATNVPSVVVFGDPFEAVNAPAVGQPLILGTKIAEDELLTVTGSGVTDADGIDENSTTFQWQRNGTDVTGATGVSYLLTQVDVGAEISVRMTYVDLKQNISTATSAPTVPVENVDDIILGNLTVDGVLEVGQVLTADASGLSDEDEIDQNSIVWSWERRDTAFNVIDEITTGSDPTFTIGLEDRGFFLRPKFSYTDTFGNASFQTVTAGFVNTPPGGAVTITGSAVAGQTVSADITGITEPDNIISDTVRYQWRRDGVDIPGAGGEGSSYALTQDDVGADITVQVTYVDEGSTEEEFISAAVVPEPLTQGTPDPDDLSGGGGDDTVNGYASNDRLEGGFGDDTLDGGSGTDTAVFDGPQAAFTLTLSPDRILITDRRPDGLGTDELISIEVLDFAPEIPLFDSGPMPLEVFDSPVNLTAEEFSGIAELYIAYFNRAPDAIGLYYWASELDRGSTLLNTAISLFPQPETRDTYRDFLSEDGTTLMNTGAFVEAVYNNVLGRGSDAGGLAYWIDELDNNDTITPANFILALINGAKFGEDTPESLADRVYLSNKVDIGLYFSATKGLSDVDASKQVMALYDGPDTTAAVVAEIDSIYADALDPVNGEFLMQLVGVIDDPFGIV